MRVGRRRRRILLAAAGSGVIILATVAVVVLPKILSRPEVRHSNLEVEGVTDVLRRDLPRELPPLRLTDATREAGIDFLHAAGGVRSVLLPEDMGSGAAWGDVDGDGDPDLYLVNQPASLIHPASGQGANVLYRNNGDGTFTDVSPASGAADTGFGMGALFGDPDGDGDLDLYVTNAGPNLLLRNRGDGTFEDVTAEAGVGDDRFSAGAAFADYDGDGDLDLYVTNYVEFRFDETDRQRASDQYGSGVPYTLNPSSYPPQANSLYRNNGDGTFTDVAEELGVADGSGRGLGVVFTDLDGDGDAEIYVANDITTNALFLNDGDGTFTDWTGPSLASDYKGAMGLAVGDFDRDADLDIFITHWVAQENTLYMNLSDIGGDDGGPQPPLRFTDAAEMVGLGFIALPWVGWGTAFVDLDLDGRLDLPVVNGSTMEDDAEPPGLIAQKNALFWNRGEDAGFFDVGSAIAPAFAAPNVGRGLACADYDADGDVDMLVTRNRGRALLLRNELGPTRRGLTVRIEPPFPGTRVEVSVGGRVEVRQLAAGPSYLSGHHFDMIFGLGGAAGAERVRVRHVDGTTAVWEKVPAGRIRIRKGDDRWEEMRP